MAVNRPSIDYVIRVMRNALDGVSKVLFNNDPTAKSVDECIKTISDIETNLERIRDYFDENTLKEISENITSFKVRIADISVNNNTPKRARLARIKNTPSKGNSSCHIDKDALEHLLSLGFSVRKIAREGLLGGLVHHNTIHKFMKANNISSSRERFSTLNDADIEEIVKAITVQFPNSGIGEVIAHLRARDPPVIVCEKRIRNLLARINPVATTRRWAQVTHRRKYRVDSPNSLWHIDTNHKLIRWNFVVHGGIDGYSRLITYLKIHTDNLALTALNDFCESVKEYGIASRVRADCGSEFVHVAKFMISVNGADRGSFITGKSVHNQRIERLWRDVYTKVLDKYHRLFHYMESFNILDPNNPTHISSLHYVYGNFIQKDLDLWRKAHNNHKVRTASQSTPLQLWHSGFVGANPSSTASRNLFLSGNEVPDIVNTFMTENAFSEPSDIGIVLPRYEFPLTDEEKARLYGAIDVNRHSSMEKIDIYADVLRYVYECVSS